MIPPGEPAETKKLTKGEKNDQLKGGQFQPGTLLRHPKAGTLEVVGPMGLPQQTRQYE